jgi:hypothetical protein
MSIFPGFGHRNPLVLRVFGFLGFKKFGLLGESFRADVDRGGEGLEGRVVFVLFDQFGRDLFLLEFFEFGVPHHRGFQADGGFTLLVQVEV